MSENHPIPFVRSIQGRKNQKRETHGHCKRGKHGKVTPIYAVWESMNQRCYDKNYAVAYRHYGGRGITVCDRWRGPNGFANFLADMGERPEGRSLDRINNDGNYEPGNCRWATWTEQIRNRRTTRMLTYNGITKPMVEFAHEYGLTLNALRLRMLKGHDLETCLTSPPQHSKKRQKIVSH